MWGGKKAVPLPNLELLGWAFTLLRGCVLCVSVPGALEGLAEKVWERSMKRRDRPPNLECCPPLPKLEV